MPGFIEKITSFGTTWLHGLLPFLSWRGKAWAPQVTTLCLIHLIHLCFLPASPVGISAFSLDVREKSEILTTASGKS